MRAHPSAPKFAQCLQALRGDVATCFMISVRRVSFKVRKYGTTDCSGTYVNYELGSTCGYVSNIDRMQVQSGTCRSSTSTTPVDGTSVTASPTPQVAASSAQLTFNDSTPSCGDVNVEDEQACVNRCREVATNTYGATWTDPREINGKYTHEMFFKAKKCTVRTKGFLCTLD